MSNDQNRSQSPVVYISIGNTDGKLPQKRWSTFIDFVRAQVSLAARAHGGELLGAWFALPDSAYQNACWCVRLPHDPAVVDKLKTDLAELGHYFSQDSVAWAVAPTTEFLAPSVPGYYDTLAELRQQLARARKAS